MKDDEIKLGMHVNFVEHNTGVMSDKDRKSSGYVTERWTELRDNKDVIYYKVHEDRSKADQGFPYHYVECLAEDILSIYKKPKSFFDG